MYSQPLRQLFRRPRIGDDYVYPKLVEKNAPIEVEDLRYSTVRVRLPFQSPSSGPLSLLSRLKILTHRGWHVENVTHFDVFFTLPVRALADPKATIDHLLVMFNGLNEILPRHSKLYDLLAHELAGHGIASVLLPTPYHLNRTPQSARDPGKLKVPTEDLKPYSPYLNFYQSFIELDKLVRLVRGFSPTEDAFGFYHKFGTQTRISLFGFSMGGLRALAKFLLDEDEDKFHKCVLLCSGSKLENLSPPGLESDEWKQLARRIEAVDWKDIKKHVHGVVDHERLYRSLDAIFHRDNFGLLRQSIENRGSRIKAIFGTEDKKVSREAIERLGQQANIETIHGMGHLVVSDPYFERDFPHIVTGIAEFLKPVRPPSQTEKEVLEAVRSELRKLGKDPGQITVEHLVNWAQNRDKRYDNLRSAYVSSKARFESDAALVGELTKKWNSIKRQGEKHQQIPSSSDSAIVPRSRSRKRAGRAARSLILHEVRV